MFDVYVVGSNEPGDEGLDKLAEAMSARYGLPLEDLRSRLARGRFRVKANVDRATGDAYVKDIQLIGGRCSLEDATQAPGQSIPPPIAVPTLARTGSTTTPPAGVYQSGLSAAFSGASIPVADLGALGGGADQYSLASLDGHDGHAGAKMPPSSGSFGPPAAAAPAPAASGKAPRPRDVPVELDNPFDGAGPDIPLAPVDPFRPPDADDDDRPVEIAADELEHRARKRVSTPPATEAVSAPPLVGRSSTRSIPPATQLRRPEPVAIVRPPSRLGFLGDEGNRFAVGVLLAILLGFVPAHLVSSSREQGAYQAIDATVEAKQASMTAQDEYDALDAFRARQLDDKRGAKHDAMILAFVIWGLVGGGIAYGWFKRVPWDRWDT